MGTIEGIVLIYSKGADWYQSFLHGIEEESVPVHCVAAENEDEITEYDALSLAKVASNYSVFEIGVGIDDQRIAIRHRLQSEDSPLLEVSRTDDEEIIRLQGHNTARIIRKLPLFLDDDRLWRQA